MQTNSRNARPCFGFSNNQKAWLVDQKNIKMFAVSIFSVFCISPMMKLEAEFLSCRLLYDAHFLIRCAQVDVPNYNPRAPLERRQLATAAKPLVFQETILKLRARRLRNALRIDACNWSIARGRHRRFALAQFRHVAAKSRELSTAAHILASSSSKLFRTFLIRLSGSRIILRAHKQIRAALNAKF